ncbi:MAG: AAA family ATPase, partial [Rhodobacterales bacterium]|nr:AAA family ATPase [Rhodobacterales bacterium]
MRIARLELYGFKSFPDRTKFEFGHGVSVVVGPNGSGKSNVVDAMRWCIGEQSARSLRGAEMLDVIFAGSASRASVGFAEVKLSLSADHGEPFPGEYSLMEEVQVGRRLHRNGTSEYLLNGVKCRRRDIVDLFMDTGVGNNSYSFIAQGQVNKMVLASAMERRSIIDEAAGISKYASRRAEAQQRLAATGTQLDRAADVADEMGRRLKVLERQVIKAARFRRFRALIRQEEIYLALVRYREIAADRRALRERLRATQGEAAGNRRELARRQTDLDSRREELQVVEAAASQWRDEVAEHDARSRELEGAKGFQEQRRKEFITQAERVEGEAKLASESLERERVEAERSSLLAAEVQLEMDGAAQRGTDLGEAVRDTIEARRAARESVDHCEAEANKARSARAIIQAKLGTAEAARDRLPAEREAAQQAVLRSELEHAERVCTHEDAERVVEVKQRDVVVRMGEVERAGVALTESQTHQGVVAQTVRDAENAVDQGGQQVDQDVEDAARAAEQKRVEAERALAMAEREAASGLSEAREDASRIQDEARDEAAQAVADAEERAGLWRRAADEANLEARNALEAEIADEERQLAAAVEVLQAHVDESTALEGRLRGARTELASLKALVPDGLTGIEDCRALV